MIFAIHSNTCWIYYPANTSSYIYFTQFAYLGWMVSGFDIWGHDANLRSHWKNRFLAFLADAATAFLPTLLVIYFIDITDILQVGIITSVVFYLYSDIPETLTGSSVGKKLFGLQVHAVDGGQVAGRVCIRNLNRLLWFVLPPLDFVLGLATRGDPRQRLLDRVAGTKVVHISEAEAHQKHLEELQEEKQPEGSLPTESCQDCGGRLILLPDEKFQCQECGLIQ